MGPVRVGNLAYEQFQHDTYGNLILGAVAGVRRSRGCSWTSGQVEFARLEVIGEQAFLLHDKPDAGIWELRSRARPHTSSAIMCWAGCDRLAKIAAASRSRPIARAFWRQRADQIRGDLFERSWSNERQAFVESFGGRQSRCQRAADGRGRT